MPFAPEAGAQCGNSARWDLCGGPPARAVPTATGRFYRSRMFQLLIRVSTYLRRWAGKKYRRLRSHRRFQRCWAGLLDRQPRLFVHWAWVRNY